jgi:hypothetical protein
MTKQAERERAEAIERLRGWVKPGDTIYTILRHRAPSGMSRVIDLVTLDYTPDWGCRVVPLGWFAAKALGDRYDGDREGIRVGGAGMDMGWHTVYNLSSALFPDGFACIGDHCPSNDHSNGMPRRHQYRPEECPGRPCGDGCDHSGTPPVTHRGGGYALLHRWL